MISARSLIDLNFLQGSFDFKFEELELGTQGQQAGQLPSVDILEHYIDTPSSSST